jgi:hypothetical protein
VFCAARAEYHTLVIHKEKEFISLGSGAWEAQCLVRAFLLFHAMWQKGRERASGNHSKSPKKDIKPSPDSTALVTYTS